MQVRVSNFVYPLLPGSCSGLPNAACWAWSHHALTSRRAMQLTCIQQESGLATRQQCQTSQLADAHCHPQLDPANMHAVSQLQSNKVAAMSVSYDVDWDIMLQLRRMAGAKVIPGFGIHPWWSHLHASDQGSTWEQLLEARDPSQLQQAIDILSHADLVTNSGAYATNRPAPRSQQPTNSNAPSNDACGGPSDSDTAFTGIHTAQAGREQEQQQQANRQPCLGDGLRVVPMQEWHGRLKQLLEDMPEAIVGEVGIDRSATIPGTKVRTQLAHQMSLLQLQVELAATFQRPISVHCVKGYGHLLDFFAALACRPETCPPRIMLHSYGGSVEDIPRFCRLPNIGANFFFSFSHAINHRSPEKLRARIAAVPDDKMLLESDQVTPLVIDDSLKAMCDIIADVKGWSIQHAADILSDNFDTFYAGQLR